MNVMTYFLIELYEFSKINSLLSNKMHYFIKSLYLGIKRTFNQFLSLCLKNF